MNTNALAVLIAPAVLLAINTAHADRGEIYGGIGYDINDIGHGPRIFGGYTIYDRFHLGRMPIKIGAEGTYLDLGTGDYSIPTVKVSERSISATAIGTLVVRPDFEVFVRAGYGLAQGRLDFPLVPTLNESASGIVPISGAGVRYRFAKHVGVRADLDRYIGMYESATSVAVSLYGTF